MQYILMLKKKINKLLIFYNYKFLDVDVRLFFYAFLLIAGIKEQQNTSAMAGALWAMAGAKGVKNGRTRQ